MRQEKGPPGKEAATGEYRSTEDHSASLAVDAKQLGALLSVSTRTIRSLDCGGKLPRPVKIGGRSVRWVVREVEDWLSHGAVDRSTWEAIKRHGRPDR